MPSPSEVRAVRQLQKLSMELTEKENREERGKKGTLPKNGAKIFLRSAAVSWK